MARPIDIRSSLPPIEALPPTGQDTPPPLASPAQIRILDEAAHLFLTTGYAETTLRQLAAAVGIKAGSIYHHFASKDEIFEAILVRGIDVMVQSFHSVSVGTDPLPLLQAHIRAHLGSLFEHGPYTAVHVTSFHSAPAAVHDRIVLIRDGYEALWTDLLQSLAAHGEIDIGTSVAMTRLILLGSMNSSLEWFHPDGNQSVDDLANAITRQFWSGVRPATDPGQPPPPKRDTP